MLDIKLPYKYNNGSLLYITKYTVDGAMNCSTDMEINPLNVSVSVFNVCKSRVQTTWRSWGFIPKEDTWSDLLMNVNI